MQFLPTRAISMLLLFANNYSKYDNTALTRPVCYPQHHRFYVYLAFASKCERLCLSETHTKSSSRLRQIKLFRLGHRLQSKKLPRPKFYQGSCLGCLNSSYGPVWRHRSRDHLIPQWPVPIGGPLERSLYPQPFSRYWVLSVCPIGGHEFYFSGSRESSITWPLDSHVSFPIGGPRYSISNVTQWFTSSQTTSNQRLMSRNFGRDTASSRFSLSLAHPILSSAYT